MRKDNPTNMSRTFHGLSGTPTYKSWHAMNERSFNPKAAFFEHYGGRGITICAEWLSIENFVADMGLRPKGKTIDRYPDINGNYEPSNCRWATHLEQQLTKRTTVQVEINGVTKSLAAWAIEKGMEPSTVHRRVKNLGMSPLDALSIPAKRGNRAHMLIGRP